jgi:hypothetical protein
MRQRQSILLAGIVLATALSAGCGEDGETTESAQPAAESTPAAPQESARPEEGSARPPATPAGVDGDGEETALPDASDHPPAEVDAVPSDAPAPPADLNEALSTLLAAAVTDEGLVRYRLLEQPEHGALLAATVRLIETATLPEDRAARLAFWCNAYNVHVLAKVLAARASGAFTSVDDVDGFFARDPIVVAGQRTTLDELENDRIRSLNDPRIHAALVCAAMSCPPLRREPYVADRLDAQLDEQCQRWVRDDTKFRMVGGRAGFSKILDWYGEDFDHPRFGGSRRGFVTSYGDTSSELVLYLLTSDDPQIEFLEYDWTLNEAP